MIKILIGYIIMVVDFGIKGINIDLMPDYIGYVLVIWGMCGIKKAVKDNRDALAAIKKGMIVSFVMFIISYVLCIMDMYGITKDFGTIASVAISVLSDIGMVIVLWFYVNMLDNIQGKDNNFQVKTMANLLKIMCLCIACQCISVSMPMVMATFVVFQMIIDVMFMIYMLVSAMTFKEKFIKKEKKQAVK